MALTSQPHNGSSAPSKSVGEKRKQRVGDSEKEDQNTSEAKSDGGDIVMPEQIDEGVRSSGDERGKKKRKRKQATDLQFEELMNDSKTSQRKRERRKKYLEKTKKHKQPKAEDDVDFPRHERIEFGDVVQAPPKLLAIPKAHKNVAGASQERIRFQAIEAYRKRKGWTSRPGLQLPSLNPAPSL